MNIIKSQISNSRHIDEYKDQKSHKAAVQLYKKRTKQLLCLCPVYMLIVFAILKRYLCNHHMNLLMEDKNSVDNLCPDKEVSLLSFPH